MMPQPPTLAERSSNRQCPERSGPAASHFSRLMGLHLIATSYPICCWQASVPRFLATLNFAKLSELPRLDLPEFVPNTICQYLFVAPTMRHVRGRHFAKVRLRICNKTRPLLDNTEQLAVAVHLLDQTAARAVEAADSDLGPGTPIVDV